MASSKYVVFTESLRPLDRVSLIMKVTSVACDWQGSTPQSDSYSGENYSQSRSSDGARPADTQGPKPVATITTGDEYIDSLRGRALDVCKHHVTKMPYEFVRLAQDIAGGLLATAPSQQDFDSQAQRIQSERQMQKELKNISRRRWPASTRL